MSERPLVWVDLRCNMVGNEGCHETWPAGFARGSRDIDVMVRRAKLAGWKIINGQTVCPTCAEKINA